MPSHPLFITPNIPPGTALHTSQKNSEWYECYRKLKAAIDNLPEDVTTAEQQRWPGQIVSPHRRAGVNAHVGRDYPESLALAPARSESLSNLIRASEHLLAIGGESVPLSNTEIVEVEACHKVRHMGAT